MPERNQWSVLTENYWFVYLKYLRVPGDFIFLPFVAKAERTGSYAGSCRGMEEKGPRERITSKEKGNNSYRNWRRGEIILVTVSLVLCV